MIEIDDNARRAIANARALLDAMLAGGWKQVCITGHEGDYFISREAGTANPLLVPAEIIAAPATDLVPFAVNAPHVGTVSWLAAVGQMVAEGDVVARLAVLDDVIEVKAAGAGQVTDHSARIDDLAEFAAPLLLLAT